MEPRKVHIGDITTETLESYCGYDYSKPILVAIKGKVYDVSKAAAKFGPGEMAMLVPIHMLAHVWTVPFTLKTQCGDSYWAWHAHLLIQDTCTPLPPLPYSCTC